ncbi:MAG: hypothetical protein AB7P97_19305 [Hyphomonadaceae bacterium]
MRDKWVDTRNYFGPDRRVRSGQKRWGEKRRLDEASEPPPLAAILRRLRVQVMNMPTPDDRRRAHQMIAAAVHQAEHLRLYACADALKRADHELRNIRGANATALEALLNEALDHAAG